MKAIGQVRTHPSEVNRILLRTTVVCIALHPAGGSPVHVGRAVSPVERLQEIQRALGSVQRILGDTGVAHRGIWPKGRFDGSIPIQ